MARPFRHRRLAGAALIAAAGVLGGCAPKDYGAQFPENFAKLDKRLVAVQTTVDRRMPKIRREIHTPSLKLRRELQGYQAEFRKMAGHLGKLNKPTDSEDEANRLTGYMRDEEDEFHALRTANRGKIPRFARAAIQQQKESSHGVHKTRPKVAALARKQAAKGS
jgi:hypothetical protein